MLAALLCLIVGISDGDTLTARCPAADPAHPYQQVRVRLAEIDAPESRQAFGQRSKRHLSDLCFKTDATIRPTATDRYGRTVARVECRGKDANLEQVKAGLAWAYTRYQRQMRHFPRPSRQHAWRVSGCGARREPQRPLWLHGSFGKATASSRLMPRIASPAPRAAGINCCQTDQSAMAVNGSVSNMRLAGH